MGVEAACGRASCPTEIASNYVINLFISITDTTNLDYERMVKYKYSVMTPFVDGMTFGAWAPGAAATPRRYRPFADLTRLEGAWLA